MKTTHNHQRAKQTAGFTLVELMLAMAGLAILMVAIAMLILKISNVYQKGLTMRSVNEAAQLIATDIQRTLNTSSPSSVNVARVDDTNGGGRLCTTTATYAWNVQAPEGQRFVKIPSGNHGDLCALVDGDLPALPQQGGTDLLSEGENEQASKLAVHNMTVTCGDGTCDAGDVLGDASQRIYRISFVLGTSEEGILESKERGCEIPKSQVDDTYCAVNNFTFTARAGNEEVE